MEQVNLTIPIPKGTITDYKVRTLFIDVFNSVIHVEIIANTGDRISHQYNNAQVMINQLNKANLSTKSLQRRILEQLITDGIILGNISGAPD